MTRLELKRFISCDHNFIENFQRNLKPSLIYPLERILTHVRPHNLHLRFLNLLLEYFFEGYSISCKLRDALS